MQKNVNEESFTKVRLNWDIRQYVKLLANSYK